MWSEYACDYHYRLPFEFWVERIHAHAELEQPTRATPRRIGVSPTCYAGELSADRSVILFIRRQRETCFHLT